ncbi:EamA family transporter [Actinomadura miaoliensis]|uniref:DMT family transporter n=1 Tax=Actinomadura miaoliensis TaxID=430685 RepID=A0ABP7WID7_9ACTN
MGVLLALASAVCYGIVDFTGGLLSRRASFAVVAVAGQAGGLALTVLLAPVIPASSVTFADLAWGAASGVGTAVGMLFLYRGLSRGAMSVVVPVSAVSGVALPVVIGVAVLHDRLSAASWLGVAVAVPALWLVSRTPDDDPSGTAAASDGLIAGTGVALQYVALAQAGSDAGIWPVLAGRVAATLVLLPLLVRAEKPSLVATLQAAAIGATAALALTFYLAATRQQLMVVAVVLSSFYPAIPVLLGVTALRERLTRWQTLGLTGAAAAVALLTTG